MADKPTSSPTHDNAARLKLRRRSRVRAAAFVVIVGLAGIATLFAGNYTVIRTETQILAARTGRFDVSRPYVDVRNWTDVDYLADPATTRTLIQHGYEHLRPYEAPADPSPGLPEAESAAPATLPQAPADPVGRRLDRIFKKSGDS